MSFPADDRLIQHVVVVVTHVAINEIVDSQTSDLTCKAGNKWDFHPDTCSFRVKIPIVNKQYFLKLRRI